MFHAKKSNLDMPKPRHQSHETLDELWVTNKISYAFVTHIKSLKLINYRGLYGFIQTK